MPYRLGRSLFLAGYALVSSLLFIACDQPPSPIRQVEEFERNAARNGPTKHSLSFRLGALSPDDAMLLSTKIKAHGGARETVSLLRFVHYFKRGQREPALVALEHVNQELAKQIVQLVRERRQLEVDLEEIDIAEGLALRKSLEGLTDCEMQVQTGQFKPLTGSDFCKVWDSGILELLPSPTKLTTSAGRALARQSLRKLPREQLRRIPRAATVLAKHEAKRRPFQLDLAQRVQREDALAKQLLELQWNIIVEFSSAR